MPTQAVYQKDREHYREYNREYLKQYRLTHPQKQYSKPYIPTPERSAYQNAYQNRSEENRKRYLARQKLNAEIRNGNMVRGDCKESGCLGKAEAHHDDYNQPLQVEWMCKTHHELFHHKHLINI